MKDSNKPSWPSTRCEDTTKRSKDRSTVCKVATYLVEGQSVPYARASQLLHELLGVQLSAGSIATFVKTCHQQLAEVESRLKAALVKTNVIHQIANWIDHYAASVLLVWMSRMLPLQIRQPSHPVPCHLLFESRANNLSG